MQIILRISLEPSQRQLLVVSEFWESLRKSESIIDLEWPSERTGRIIEILSKEEIALWHAYMQFGKKELDNFDCLELVPSQVVNISRTDSNLFDKVLAADQAITRNRKHKIPSRIIASSIKLNENSIASYGGFSDELIASDFVIGILSKYSLTGWNSLAVFKRDGSVHTIYKRINAKNLVEVETFDISTPKTISGLDKKTMDKFVETASLDTTDALAERELRQEISSKFGERKETEEFTYLGCKTLKPNQAAGLDDFSRLGTSEHSDMLTGWVVSQKARECFIRNKIKGIKFRPIMISGRESHRMYLKLWHDAISFLASHNTTYQHMPLEFYLKKHE